jgi:hypothetical protein
MIPKSVSASSLDVAEKCMAMYRASHLDRGAGLGNPAAQLGTTLHAALEKFVDPSMIKSRRLGLGFAGTLLCAGVPRDLRAG